MQLRRIRTKFYLEDFAQQLQMQSRMMPCNVKPSPPKPKSLGMLRRRVTRLTKFQMANRGFFRFFSAPTFKLDKSMMAVDRILWGKLCVTGGRRVTSGEQTYRFSLLEKQAISHPSA